MPARLSISTEEGLILDLRLGSQQLRIGRAKDNSVRSEDRRTSRHHAALRRLPDGMYEIEDLGSSYGTLLNGRAIKKEPLRHQDIVRCGGLLMQLFVDNTPDEVEADASIVTTTLDNLFEARTQIRRLIEEQAALRSEVGTAQNAEDRAKAERDDFRHEAERLGKLYEELKAEKATLLGRIDELGRELRERLATKSDAPPDVDALRQQLADSQKQSERNKSRALELEERETARLQAEQALRKDVERMADQLKQREAREAQLAAALKPALMRIAELQQELEHTRVKLAKVEAELADTKKR
ncbi:MAG TPA: FHA domain-containing protein [Pseudomonadota bacterium]|nr:FHA domain-containing protein [Pseudomonadota bacterium]